MSIGILTSGNSAMQAAYTQLQVTAHNIANVNTPGYSRQEAVTATAGANFTGAGYIGRGVELQTVKRNYNEYLTREVRLSESAAAGQGLRAQEMSRVDRLFANANQGVGAAIDDLALAWGDVVNRPFDASARSAVLARAQTMTQRVASFDQQLDQSAKDTDARLLQTARGVNPTLTKLAKLNDQIAALAASSQPPNDLLDLRDQMISQVNKTVRAVSYENPDGTVNVFTAGGAALVLGNRSATMGAQTNPVDGSLEITLTTSGTSITQTAASLGGGELSGLLEFRDQDLSQVRAKLGQLVGRLASSLNQAQESGTDSLGQKGSAMFAFGLPKLLASNLNTGNAVLAATVSDGQALSASDYQVGFDGSQYQVKRLMDGVVSNYASLPAQFDGLSLTSSNGTPAAGDSFMLKASSAFTAGFHSMLTQPTQLAAGMAMTAVASASNTGSVTANSFAVQGSHPNLRAPVTLSFTSATSFDVRGTGTGDPSGLSYAPAQTLAFNGWTLQLNGTPRAGDVITITPVSQPSADNRNAQKMLALFDQTGSEGTTFTGGYADLLADVGIKARSAKDASSLSNSLLANAQAAQSEVSGVNLDEEAAKLIQFQQAYQAAAKLISTGQQMFESLMNAMR